jgi:MarR family transcriptional regulator, organic hydroperoxide resistance regulator
MDCPESCRSRRELPRADVLSRMRRVARTVQAVSSRNALEAGLNQSDFQALVRLVAADGLTGAEVGRILGMTSSSITELADRLERSGMVTRTRSASDRRLVVLKPTARGRRVADDALRPTLDEMSELLGELGEDELEVIDHFLGEVDRRLLVLLHGKRTR